MNEGQAEQTGEGERVASVEVVPIDGIIEEARRDAVAEVDIHERYADFDSHTRSGLLCDLFDGRLPSVVTAPRTSKGRKAGVWQEGPCDKFVELIDSRRERKVEVHDKPTPRGPRRVETTALVCSVGDKQYKVIRTRTGGVETSGYGNNKTEHFLVMSDTISVTPREGEEVGGEG